MSHVCSKYRGSITTHAHTHTHTHSHTPSLTHSQKYVQMSTLDDKDVQSAEQWEAAVQFMTSSVKKQIKVAEDELNRIEGPTSYYDRWVRWRSQTDLEAKRQAIALELGTFLKAEPVCGILCIYRVSPIRI